MDYGPDDLEFSVRDGVVVAHDKNRRVLKAIERAHRGMMPGAYRERGVGLHCERLTLREISELSKETKS